MRRRRRSPPTKRRCTTASCACGASRCRRSERGAGSARPAGAAGGRAAGCMRKRRRVAAQHELLLRCIATALPLTRSRYTHTRAPRQAYVGARADRGLWQARSRGGRPALREHRSCAPAALPAPLFNTAPFAPAYLMHPLIVPTHAQVAKNITLAGVGSVTLLDDAPASDHEGSGQLLLKLKSNPPPRSPKTSRLRASAA